MEVLYTVEDIFDLEKEKVSALVSPSSKWQRNTYERNSLRDLPLSGRNKFVNVSIRLPRKNYPSFITFKVFHESNQSNDIWVTQPSQHFYFVNKFLTDNHLVPHAISTGKNLTFENFSLSMFPPKRSFFTATRLLRALLRRLKLARTTSALRPLPLGLAVTLIAT